MPATSQKIIIVHEQAEGNTVYGFEAPEGYDAPQGAYDAEFLADLEESDDPDALARIERVHTIVKLLNISVDFDNGDWINVHDEGEEFFKAFSLDQLS